MTRAGVEAASQQQRLLYGPVIKELREAKGLTQLQLQEAAGVTARTIRNIEQGKVAGQAEKLIRILIALGVDVDGELYAEAEPYTRMLAPVILRIAPEHRAAAVVEAIDVLAGAVVAHPHDAERPSIRPLRPLAPVAPDDEIDDVQTPPDLSTLPAAAKNGKRAGDAAPIAD